MTGSSPRCEWNSSEESILVDTLVKEKAAGHQAESGWKSVAWKSVVEALEKDGARKKTAEQCKNHWQKLKKEYRIVKALWSLSGFGWDDDLKQVTAEASVWDEYLLKHPDAKPFRKKGFPLYDEIAGLVDGVVATGENAFSVGGTAENSFGSATGIISDDKGDKGDKGVTTDDENDEGQQRSASRSLEHSDFVSTAGNGGRKRKRSNRETGTQAMSSLARSVESLVASVADPVPSTSPARKRAAWKLILDEEDLSDNELAVVPKIFRGGAQLADEYLHFPPAKKRARTMWLRGELDRIMGFDGADD